MKEKLKNNVYWVGKIDWELTKFHGDDYSITSGSSQNAYLIEEEKTVLIDTVWTPHKDEFIENLEKEIDLAKLDAVIIQHGEVDHSGGLVKLMEKRPDLPIYCTANGVKSLVGQFHHPEWDYRVVKTGDSLNVGPGKDLVFVEMAMLHWPDSMASYLTGDNILFSNDAFGQHFAVAELFNDKADQCLLYKEAIKYYANILTPFQAIAKKKIDEILAMNLPIEIIAPSHGVIWRDNPLQIVEKYIEWSDQYKEDQITIAYDSMWDGTKKLAHALEKHLRDLAPDTVVKVFNVALADKNEVMTEVFKSKAIAVGSPTVSNDILSSVGGWLYFLKELKFKGKKAAAFGCYGWSGEGNKKIKEQLEGAGFSVLEPDVRVNWAPREENLDQMSEIAQALIAD
ncbi:MAG TPA: MBL fold metallo-hydrolase [Clostridia bacterium]|nr:MBL fold metallo-hydrolase [Clostridia bacterium]